MSKLMPLLGISFLLGTAQLPAATCESLASLDLPDARITMAVSVPAGKFTQPDAAPQYAPGLPAAEFKDLPPFCRVLLTMRPSDDSDVKVEVWLPSTGWNHKFVAVGNGGFGGRVSYPNMSSALYLNYATSSTDTGHSGRGGSFALGHPERVTDYAYRSVHQMTLAAKAVITAFYGEAPRRSYWNSCSAGGRQGFKEAQLFPEDFDGIIAGAPAVNWTGRAVQAVWIAQGVHQSDAHAIPPSKFPLLHNGAIAACDALDGVKDGVLDDPRNCQFDPGALLCKGDDAPSCLTREQVETARRIYSPVMNAHTKQVVFPGHERGSELGWRTMASLTPFDLGLDHFKYVVFRDPDWNYKTFDFDRDLLRTAEADRGTLNGRAIDGGLINAMSPDLTAFFQRGGKVIQYHGWSDPQISPRSSVGYYESVVQKVGTATADNSHRLFMVPGMAHCGGGDGPNMFDPLTALERWVENGTAPDQMVASRVTDGKVVRTRPLCPYPQVAKYNGVGSTDDASNFSCKVP